MLSESEMDIEGMGTEEQLVGLRNNNDANNHVAKGKRTKRLRPLSPCAVAPTAVTSSCSSANSDEHVSACGESGSFSSTTTIFKSTNNQEEEDMAKCLILLAQGKGGEDDVEGNKNKNTKSVMIATATTTAITAAKKIGFYIYECKTCNKTFQSFQALGGHRASHKRPKVTLEEKETPPPSLPPPPPLITNFEFEEAKESHIKSRRQIPISLQLGCGNNRGFHGNKSKIHECSICGSEFTSGQALGGHMRRHRASTTTSDGATAAMAEVKPRNVLEWDLNLPAPEEDVRDSKFQFTATQKSMVLSPAPALVGCHY